MQTLGYYVLAGILALGVLAGFGSVRLIKVLGYGDVNSIADWSVTGIVLIGGSELVGKLVRISGLGGGGEAKGQPLEISGINETIKCLTFTPVDMGDERCDGKTKMENSAPTQPKPHRFPALTVPHFRIYAATALLSMAADNIEHVIAYWVIWQLTHSPFWLGYAVVAHWLPFTLFSFYSGSLADRIDCRWLIQISQGLFSVSSFGWGFLYLTGQLQIWHMAVLLVIHGIAGLIFTPSSMLIIHEMVGPDKLISAVSLNAILRPLSATVGPAIGGLLMGTVGPGWGFVTNIFLYLPMSVSIMFYPYRGATAGKRSESEWSFVLEGFQVVRQNPMIVALLVVVAASSLLLGNAFQALLPAFAQQLGVSSTGYSILLSANGLGAILGGFLLGWAGSTKLRPVMVTAGALAWSFLLMFFAVSTIYSISLILLCMLGAMQITFVSMSQSIVQAWAPQAVRGRVVGVYNFAAQGLRAPSGLFMGSLAIIIGPATALLFLAGIIGLVILGVSAAIRALWEWEMKKEALPSAYVSPLQTF